MNERLYGQRKKKILKVHKSVNLQSYLGFKMVYQFLVRDHLWSWAWVLRGVLVSSK